MNAVEEESITSWKRADVVGRVYAPAVVVKLIIPPLTSAAEMVPGVVSVVLSFVVMRLSFRNNFGLVG